ncbi:MAG: two-component regulator propeller domain-containing protein, partial [Ignavibacteriaceae bacterium]
MKKRIKILVFFYCISYLSFGQPKNIQFDHLTTKDGLSHNSVTSIVQDSQGFMWFGTNYGLNRWNGYEFKTFTHDPRDSCSLSDSKIEALFVDSRNIMWVGTWSGLNKFDCKTEKFISFSASEGNTGYYSNDIISQIIEDNNGNIWLATTNGLCKIDPVTEKISRFLPAPKNRNDFWNPNIIVTVCEIDSNKLLLGTASGLYSFNPKSGDFIKDPIDDPFIKKTQLIGRFYKDNNKNLWM